MRLTWDELALAFDALFEMRIRADQESRATIGALGVKVNGELRTLWATLCSGAEHNQTRAEMDLTRDEMHTLVLALMNYKERARQLYQGDTRATLDRLRELDALQEKIQHELDRTAGEGGKE